MFDYQVIVKNEMDPDDNFPWNNQALMGKEEWSISKEMQNKPFYNIFEAYHR